MHGKVAVLALCFTAFATQAEPIFRNGFEPAEPVSLTVEINPGNVLLTSAGQERQLSARVTGLDLQPVTALLHWRSSRPDVVSVTPEGLIRAEAGLGSAQIMARAEGALEAMAMVVVATPAPGAILVQDDQVVVPPAAVDAQSPFGLGFQTITRLSGISDPAPGTLIIGTGQQPVGGRVVSTSAAADGIDVTLEVTALSELFDQLDLDERIKLSSLPLVPNPRVSNAYDIQVFTDGSLRLTEKAAADKGVISTSVLFDFDRDCSAMPASILDIINIAVGPSIDLNPDINLDIVHGSSGIVRFVVAGTLQAVFEIQPRLQTNFGGKITCELEVGSFPIPLGGPFSALLNGQVGVGPGFEISGNVSLAEQVGYDLTVTASSQFSAGIDCETNPDCEMVGALDLDADGAFRPVLPPLGGLTGSAKLQASGRGFLFAKVGLGTFFSALSFKPLAITGGLRFGLDLESALSQSNNPAYASDYKLDLVGTAGASTDIEQLFSMIGFSIPTLTFEIANVLSQSPKGTLVISDPSGNSSAGSTIPSVRAGSDSQTGDLATFTVSLSSSTFLTDYAVDRIEIFERKPDGNGGFVLEPGRPGCNTFTPTPGQTEFSCQTDFLEPGTRTFHAFVRSSVFGVPIPLSLELGNQTAASVEVTATDLYFAHARVLSSDGHIQIVEDTSTTQTNASLSLIEASASGSAGGFRMDAEVTTSPDPADSSHHNFGSVRTCFVGEVRMPPTATEAGTLSAAFNATLSASATGGSFVELSVATDNGYCQEVFGQCFGRVLAGPEGNSDQGALAGALQGPILIPLGQVPPGSTGVALNLQTLMNAQDGGGGSYALEILVDGQPPMGSSMKLQRQMKGGGSNVGGCVM